MPFWRKKKKHGKTIAWRDQNMGGHIKETRGIMGAIFFSSLSAGIHSLIMRLYAFSVHSLIMRLYAFSVHLLIMRLYAFSVHSSFFHFHIYSVYFFSFSTRHFHESSAVALRAFGYRVLPRIWVWFALRFEFWAWVLSFRHRTASVWPWVRVSNDNPENLKRN